MFCCRFYIWNDTIVYEFRMFFIMRNSCSADRIQLYVVCGSFGKMHREWRGFPQKEDFLLWYHGSDRNFGMHAGALGTQKRVRPET